jgi:hypothetical protein
MQYWKNELTVIVVTEFSVIIVIWLNPRIRSLRDHHQYLSGISGVNWFSRLCRSGVSHKWSQYQLDGWGNSIVLALLKIWIIIEFYHQQAEKCNWHLCFYYSKKTNSGKKVCADFAASVSNLILTGTEQFIRQPIALFFPSLSRDHSQKFKRARRRDQGPFSFVFNNYVLSKEF